MKFSRSIITILSVWIAVLPLYGCAHEQVSEDDVRHQMLESLRDRIRTFQDPGRKNQLMSLIDVLERDIGAFYKTIDEFRNDMKNMNKNYDARKDDFQELLNRYNSERKDYQMKIISSYFMIKELMTSEEWKTLAKIEDKMLSDGIRWTLIDKNE